MFSFTPEPKVSFEFPKLVTLQDKQLRKPRANSHLEVNIYFCHTEMEIFQIKG